MKTTLLKLAVAIMLTAAPAVFALSGPAAAAPKSESATVLACPSFRTDATERLHADGYWYEIPEKRKGDCSSTVAVLAGGCDYYQVRLFPSDNGPSKPQGWLRLCPSDGYVPLATNLRDGTKYRVESWPGRQYFAVRG